MYHPTYTPAVTTASPGVLVNRAVASGDIRLDLDPLDLLRALAGVANIGLGPNGEQAANQVIQPVGFQIEAYIDADDFVRASSKCSLISLPSVLKVQSSL